MSGYDVSNNTFLPEEQMRKIEISQAAKRTLKDGGLLYTGLNGYGAGAPYLGRRFL